jgi:hypothetical protein
MSCRGYLNKQKLYIVAVYMGANICIYCSVIRTVMFMDGGTRYRCWLRHCAISQKVAGMVSWGVKAAGA